MMPELSLNILDVAENSTRAGASCVEITIDIDTEADRMTIEIADNGCGMSKEQIERVTDPFFSTRETRRIGLGVPFFKQAAEITGGSFSIESEEGVGTTVRAEFVPSSIDCSPLGDVNETLFTLITCHPETDFVYTLRRDGEEEHLDTREGSIE